MRIASWNVNSLRARLEHVSEWLRKCAPDVACLQETKVEDAKFPAAFFEELGYRVFYFGQKTYNGLAVAVRFGLSADDARYNLDGDDADAPRRLLACTVEGVRIVSVYVPNGQAVGTQAFAYKLLWLDRLRAELAARHTAAEPLLVCGDFNVAPDPIDVHDPRKWEGQVLFHPEERVRLAKLRDWGLVDGFRKFHQDAGAFTWWDYRLNNFKRNWGLRIDHALMTAPLAERCRDVWIDLEPRRRERPSDHAPIVVELDS
jgi:exodeoxyribonuclease III